MAATGDDGHASGIVTWAAAIVAPDRRTVVTSPNTRRRFRRTTGRVQGVCMRGLFRKLHAAGTRSGLHRKLLDFRGVSRSRWQRSVAGGSYSLHRPPAARLLARRGAARATLPSGRRYSAGIIALLR